MFTINLMSSKSIPHEGAHGDYYVAFDDGAKLVPTAIYKHEHEDLMASAQRPADHYKAIAADFENTRKLGLWMVILGVHGACRILDENGELVQIALPEDEEEAAKHAHEIEFVDGQNRTLALEQILEMINGGYPVITCILDDPTKEEVMDRFSEVNGTAKPMSKDLLFEFDYERNRLPKNQHRAYELIVRLNEDPKSPLFNRIKFGNGTGYSAKTIVEFVCSGPRDLIASMERAGKHTIEDQYKVLMRHWQGIAMENSSDSTLGSPKQNNGARKRLSAQKVAYATSICETAIEILRNNDKNLTIGNLQSIYRMWVNDILRVNKLIESDNGTIEYYNTEGEKIDVVTDRWNGRGRASKAIQSDHDLLFKAYANELRV